MPIRMECDFPYAGESLPLGALASFVQQAQAGGADLDTPVLAVTAPQDDAIVVALQVEFEPASPANHPPEVRLDRSEVAHALDVLAAIEDNDGDARMQLAAIRDLRRLLTQRALQ